MAEAPGVAVEGLAEFRKGLKSIADELPKMLQKELKAVAETAAERARGRYQRQFKQRSGKTVGSIRATATQASASVAFGGARYPWVAGQEFGSNAFQQFFPYTGTGPGGRGSWGRVIFPAVREEQEGTMENVQHRLDDLARRAYPEA